MGLSPVTTKPHLLILTGSIGRGKTTLLKEVIDEGHLQVQGFLSLKDFSRPHAVGITLLVLPQGKSIPMGISHAPTPPEALKRELSTSRFAFHDGAFARVDALFEVIREDLPFVFDEFGKLELRGQGHLGLYQRLMDRAHPTLLVVRKELLDIFASRCGQGLDYAICDLDTQSEAAVARCIRCFLQDDCHPVDSP